MTSEQLRIIARKVDITVDGPGPIWIGRDDDADVRIDERAVSRRHARLVVDPTDGWVLEDLGSRAGTYVAGKAVRRVLVGVGLDVRLGAPFTGVQVSVAPARADASVVAGEVTARDGTAPVVRIGRAAGNDVVVADPLASRNHAELHVDAQGSARIVDLASHNGTFVGGSRVLVSSPVRSGERVTIGGTSFRYHDGLLERHTDAGAPLLHAAAVTVDLPGGPRILDGVSFALKRGELLAVVGPTGSGKSTLLKALTGARPPDRGDVLVGGTSLYSAFDEMRRRIGYVPQDDILHPQLSVRRALAFGAAIRLPVDTNSIERDRAVESVIDALGLSERADVPIDRLSGGQRKRTNVALELLSRPDVLFLDEPTSGLDPGFEKTIMELLRELADDGRAIVVVTHSVASLGLCDRVLFLATGGHVAFLGSPAAASAHFGGRDYADVFRELESGSARWISSGEAAPLVVGTQRRSLIGSGRSWRRLPATERARRRRDWLARTGVVMHRQFAVTAADRRNYVFLAAEALVPALLIAALVTSGAFDPAGSGKGARTLLGAIVVATAAIGAANAIREIVKETPLYLRERAVGLPRSAYITAKLFSIGAITAVQVVVLTMIAVARAGGPRTSNALFPPHFELVAGLVLGGCAAVALGLCISAFVSSSEKAMALIAVVFIAQWLFAGAAVDLQRQPLLRPVAYLTSANWAMATSASTVNLFELEDSCGGPSDQAAIAVDTPPCDWRWQHDAGHWLFAMFALVFLTALTAFAADRLLARKEPLQGV